MLNLYSELINNFLLNSLLDELPELWLERMDLGAKKRLVKGYYNAGVVSIDMSVFNNDRFYDNIIRKDFRSCCEDLYKYLGSILTNALRALFLGFNDSIPHYKIVINFEAAEDDQIEAVKFQSNVF